MPRLTAIRKQALDEIMKAALFEAAVQVLGDDGVEKLTMDRVAIAAGMAKGNLYRYFASKQDLLEFVHAKIIDPLIQDLDVNVASAQPAVAKLDAHLRTLLEHMARYAQVFRLLFHDDAAQRLIRSSDRCRRRDAGQRLAEICRQGIAEGVLRSIDPTILANMFMGLGRGLLEDQPELQQPEQRDRMRHLILDAFLHGVAAPRTTADGKPCNSGAQP